MTRTCVARRRPVHEGLDTPAINVAGAAGQSRTSPFASRARAVSREIARKYFFR